MSESKIELVIPDPHYTLLDASRGDMPEVLVVNDALVGFGHAAIFPWHLCVTLQAQELVENDMPSPDESALLFGIGDEIEATVLDGRTDHGSAVATPTVSQTASTAVIPTTQPLLIGELKPTLYKGPWIKRMLQDD